MALGTSSLLSSACLFILIRTRRRTRRQSSCCRKTTRAAVSTQNSSRADMRYLRRVPWSNLCLTSSSKHFPCFTQVPPPESTTQSAQADVHDASAPISILLLSVPSLPYILPPPVFSPQKGTVTAGTETISLQHSGSNTPLVWSSLSSLSKWPVRMRKTFMCRLRPWERRIRTVHL